MKTVFLAIALCICAFLAPDLYLKIENEYKEKEVPEVYFIEAYIDDPIEMDSAYIKLDSTIQNAEKNSGWINNVIKKNNEQ
jgi:hypothetical protein